MDNTGNNGQGSDRGHPSMGVQSDLSNEEVVTNEGQEQGQVNQEQINLEQSVLDRAFQSRMFDLYQEAAPHQSLSGTPANSVANIPPAVTLERPAVPSCITASTLRPTYTGLVHHANDAMLVVQLAVKGVLPMIRKRPSDRERRGMVVSGAFYCYDVVESGIQRWTDDVTWSPSRSVCNNFLVYRQIKPRTGSEKLRARRNAANMPRRKKQRQAVPYAPASYRSGRIAPAGTVQGDHDIVGALVDTYDFVEDGWIKRTFKVCKFDGATVHLVGYLKLEHARAMLNKPQFTPSGDARLNPRTSKFHNVIVDWNVFDRHTVNKNRIESCPLEMPESTPGASFFQVPESTFHAAPDNGLGAVNGLPLGLFQQFQPQPLFNGYVESPHQDNESLSTPGQFRFQDAVDMQQQQEQYGYHPAPQQQHGHLPTLQQHHQHLQLPYQPSHGYGMPWSGQAAMGSNPMEQRFNMGDPNIPRVDPRGVLEVPRGMVPPPSENGVVYELLPAGYTASALPRGLPEAPQEVVTMEDVDPNIMNWVRDIDPDTNMMNEENEEDPFNVMGNYSLSSQYHDESSTNNFGQGEPDGGFHPGR